MVVALRSSPPEILQIPESERMQQCETVEEDDACGSEISGYELCREERIRENRERMQKLGIFSIAQKLNSPKSTPVRAYRKAPRLHSPPSVGPTRRSSRLQSSTPVSYCELRSEKKEKPYDILSGEGSTPEVYTEEHDKMLGSAEMSWTLSVDGYGKDGKRIYDPLNGKSCHQCRQKTLGQRTHCSNCNMVQGQFCGDCLYMRYGENVLEANANPDWICPVCRGICNCSLCRHAKGWPPTGILYKKILNLGYKSVAHYLIQTRRAQTDKVNNVVSKAPVSAKRSLPFSGIEVTGEDSDLSKPSHECSNPNPVSISDKESSDFKLPPESGDKPLLYPADDALTKDQVEHPLKPEVGKDSDSPEFDGDKESIHVACTVCVIVTDVKTEPLNERGDDDAYEIEKEESVPDIKCGIESETSPKSTKKRAGYKPAPDSIGRRLRMRRTGPKLASHTEDASTTADVGGIASRLRKRCRV
ncbi:hypothetical protein SASPL_139947 [Salvia splendens]|uniref:Zinc-finger domain-containing protein n=1 Tax=Salvia splendens TaxID=180675 RepID=A0A8X8WPC1_SALSN|nr:uncharacterized protein LOC121768766 [Salvia splendens]KAG6398485.1 hypothetical protein SASPL_139947 [Salvia splendens]